MTKIAEILTSFEERIKRIQHQQDLVNQEWMNLWMDVKRELQQAEQLSETNNQLQALLKKATAAEPIVEKPAPAIEETAPVTQPVEKPRVVVESPVIPPPLVTPSPIVEASAPAPAPAPIAAPAAPSIKPITPQASSQGSDQQKSVNDKFSARQPELADKLQLKPITDIKSAINTNDKFSYIQHLFDGDMHTYLEAIQTLNNADSINTALNLIETRYKQEAWSKEPQLVNKFMQLIARRFASGS